MLIIPRKHIKNTNTIEISNESLRILKKMEEIALRILNENKQGEEAYKIGFHRSFATSIDHLHLHAF